MSKLVKKARTRRQIESLRVLNKARVEHSKAKQSKKGFMWCVFYVTCNLFGFVAWCCYFVLLVLLISTLMRKLPTKLADTSLCCKSSK